MKIQFIGATHEVTGSCTLLEVAGKFYLVDCGMEQGKDVFQNIALPIPASKIEAVFLTHAHIDHSGMLPRLYRDGFKGSIYATEATTNLCDIMLRDSAHIQEFEAQWRSRKAERAGGKTVEPVYDTQDAIKTIALFRRCRYGEIIRVAEGVDLSNVVWTNSLVDGYWALTGMQAVPEPAEWAMIFGGIALGFAIYRRRK